MVFGQIEPGNIIVKGENATLIAKGNIADRPVGSVGMIRYCNDKLSGTKTGKFEGFQNGKWTSFITSNDIMDDADVPFNPNENITLKVLSEVLKDFFGSAMGGIHFSLGGSNSNLQAVPYISGMNFNKGANNFISYYAGASAGATISFVFDAFTAIGIPAAKKKDYKITLFNSVSGFYDTTYYTAWMLYYVRLIPMWDITSPTASTSANYGKYQGTITVYGNDPYHSANVTAYWVASATKFQNF